MSGKSEIRNQSTTDDLKVDVEIWVSYCHNYGSLEKAKSELSEGPKVNKRATLDMLERACEGNREQANTERDQDRLHHETQ